MNLELESLVYITWTPGWQKRYNSVIGTKSIDLYLKERNKNFTNYHFGRFFGCKRCISWSIRFWSFDIPDWGFSLLAARVLEKGSSAPDEVQVLSLGCIPGFRALQNETGFGQLIDVVFTRKDIFGGLHFKWEFQFI